MYKSARFRNGAVILSPLWYWQVCSTFSCLAVFAYIGNMADMVIGVSAQHLPESVKEEMAEPMEAAGEWSSLHTACPGISFSPSGITGGKGLFGCFRKELLQITLGISECRANSFVTVF
ncbi:MAG: hypothetical protein HFH85_12715 [Lachnospiraceae bacterium]|nr:hypothetical protein [Lachnospiraceae bacterium]